MTWHRMPVPPKLVESTETVSPGRRLLHRLDTIAEKVRRGRALVCAKISPARIAALRFCKTVELTGDPGREP